MCSGSVVEPPKGLSGQYLLTGQRQYTTPEAQRMERKPGTSGKRRAILLYKARFGAERQQLKMLYGVGQKSGGG